jgi:hypothetical protein
MSGEIKAMLLVALGLLLFCLAGMTLEYKSGNTFIRTCGNTCHDRVKTADVQAKKCECLP